MNLSIVKIPDYVIKGTLHYAYPFVMAGFAVGGSGGDDYNLHPQVDPGAPVQFVDWGIGVFYSCGWVYVCGSAAERNIE
jgi:hypothetical protein